MIDAQLLIMVDIEMVGTLMKATCILALAIRWTAREIAYLKMGHNHHWYSINAFLFQTHSLNNKSVVNHHRI